MQSICLKCLLMAYFTYEEAKRTGFPDIPFLSVHDNHRKRLHSRYGQTFMQDDKVSIRKIWNENNFSQNTHGEQNKLSSLFYDH